MESTASAWSDPQCPFRVEWAPDKLNQLRIAVVDAFYALPRGGIEIGGLLLGRVEGKMMHIESFAQMECEHLTGPSFVLSPKDEAALQTQLAALGGQVVGWFHSHTRSEIHFSSQDLEVHNRFFQKASQIAMVLRPANSQPPRANYFFRGPGGAMIGGSAAFVVEAMRAKPAPAAAPKVSTAVTPQPPPVAEVTSPPPPPLFLREPVKPANKPNLLWIYIALTIAALGACAFFTRDLWMPK